MILLLAVPILIQVYFNSGLAYLLNRRLGVPHCVAGPSALIGASNFFELAVATAIVLFGFQSGAALATVVGVLVEVPVMLTVVRIVNRDPALVRGRRRRADPNRPGLAQQGVEQEAHGQDAAADDGHEDGDQRRPQDLAQDDQSRAARARSPTS